MFKKLFSFALIFFIAAGNVQADPQREAGSTDALPYVLYGKDSTGALRALKTDADGKLSVSSSGGTSYDEESDTLTITADNVKLRGWNERWEGSDGIGYIDFNDCPVAGCVSLGGKINFNGANMIFLIEGDDVDAMIASDFVQSGDVVVMPSVTSYAITADIDITKDITLDCNGATITSSTANINLIELQSDGITLQNCNFSDTSASVGQTTDIIQAQAASTYTNITLRNIVINSTGNYTRRGLAFTNIGGRLDNVTININTNNENARCGYIQANGSDTVATTLEITNFKCNATSSSSGSGDVIYGLDINESAAQLDYTVNIRDSEISAVEVGGSAGTAKGLITSGDQIKVNLFTTLLRGSDGDVEQASSSVITGRDITLYNGTVTGTLTLAGQTRSGSAYFTDYYSGDGTQGATTTCTIAGLTSITVKDGLITACA